jgi:aldose sugar dehydrogenase
MNCLKLTDLIGILKSRNNPKFLRSRGVVLTAFLFLVFILVLVFASTVLQYAYSTNKTNDLPHVKDPGLKVEEIGRGIPSSPTSMDFLDSNNILVTLKGDGFMPVNSSGILKNQTAASVFLISNDVLQPEPVLRIPVNITGERGLLGIAIKRDEIVNSSASPGNMETSMVSAANKSKITVFLYYTEKDEDQPARNRIYAYQWNGTKLINPTLILDIPAENLSLNLAGQNHQGGKLLIGPDGYLYAVIGDVGRGGVLQNIKNSDGPSDTSVIFRINPENGLPAEDNPFTSNNKSDPMNRYYAYGIRNSFGMTFDPVTGTLWDTENGDKTYDEINLIRPGFNSGWYSIMGPISRSNITEAQLANNITVVPGSKYYDPIFSWRKSIGVTGLDFLNSSKLGDEYKNNLFVGDFNNGNLYYFKVNDNRSGLQFENRQTGMSDLVADNTTELSDIIFGTGFGTITDVKTGPDGSLYVLDFYKDRLFRITKLN